MSIEEPLIDTIPVKVVMLKPQLNTSIGIVGSTVPPRAEPAFDVEQIKKELTDPRAIS